MGKGRNQLCISAYKNVLQSQINFNLDIFLRLIMIVFLKRQ